MLKLARLPYSAGNTQARYGGKCRPGQFVADARFHANTARAEASRRAVLAWLLPLLLLLAALLTHCAPAKTATEAHRTDFEHGLPIGWHAGTDTLARP